MKLNKGAGFLVLGWLCVGAGGPAGADGEYILRVTKTNALDRVCRSYGLTVVRKLGWMGAHVVTGPAGADPATLEARVRVGRNVRSFQRDHVAVVGEVAAHRDLEQSAQALDEVLAVDRSIVDFHGVPTWAGFPRQPAASLIGLEQSRAEGQTGAGIVVAVIDTGVDHRHPLLQGALVDDGYDFTRNEWGAHDWKDLPSQSTAAILEEDRGCDPAVVVQSTTAILEQSTTAILETNCRAAIVNQSTAAILEEDTVQALTNEPALPPAFGHGTMVAGLVRLVAPEARILPIKAFRADGTGRSSDIAQAIYYAVWRGARVINMSFTFSQVSQEVMWATAHAAMEGVVLVASSGNRALLDSAWPAYHKWVVGVGSTTIWDTRSAFSNYGEHAFKVGAPGENLVTTYPGGRYAMVSGTSFSAALISGTVGLMAQAASGLEWGATDDVMSFSPFVIIPGTTVTLEGGDVVGMRVVTPTAVANAPVMERNRVKQIHHLN